MIAVHVIRKPLSEGNVASNVLKWETGALNIDASRLGFQLKVDKAPTRQNPVGRWPANLILEHHPECVSTGEQGVCVDGCPVAELDNQGERVGVHSAGHAQGAYDAGSDGGWGFIGKGAYGNARYGDKGGASRFFKQVKEDS